MNTKSGGPAFPFSLHPEHGYGPAASANEGMSLRDYFAAAFASVAAQDEVISPTYNGPTYQGTAERAYLYADAMIKARDQATELSNPR